MQGQSRGHQRGPQEHVKDPKCASVQKLKGDFKVSCWGLERSLQSHLGGSREANEEALHDGSYTIPPESSVQSTKVSQEQQACFSLLFYPCPMVYHLLTPRLLWLLPGSHTPPRNISCLDPNTALKTIGLWTVHVLWSWHPEPVPRRTLV